MRQIPIDTPSPSILSRLLSCACWRSPMAWIGIIGLSLLCLGAALISQHVLDMRPCPWCIVQRMIWIAIIPIAFAGWGFCAFAGSQIIAGIGVIMVGGLGIAAALWQYFFAAPAGSCAFTWADRFIGQTQLDAWFPFLFQPLASCAEAEVKLLGIPYAIVSALMFSLLTLWGLGLICAELQRLRKPL